MNTVESALAKAGSSVKNASDELGSLMATNDGNDIYQTDSLSQQQLQLNGQVFSTLRPDVVAMRAGIQEIGKRYNGNVKVVEVPPGPPVMSTVVAEIYGPDYDQQIAVADQVKNQLAKTNDVVDVDWSVESNQKEYKLEVDKDKAMKIRGIDSLESLRSQALASGVEFIACQMSMDVMGVKREELLDEVSVGGVATYM